MVIPFPPGGTLDTAGRMLAQKMSESTGQTFVVENKPGAGGNLASQALKSAPADGSVYMLASDQVYIAPITMKSFTSPASTAAISAFSVAPTLTTGKSKSPPGIPPSG